MPSDASLIHESLSGRGWLGDLDPAIANTILEAGRLMLLPKGRVLFGPADTTGGFFGVVSGGIVLSTASVDGFPVPGHISRSGNWFGYGSVLVSPRRTLLAHANEASDVLYLSLATARRLRETAPEFMRAFSLLPAYGEATLLAIVSDLLIPDSERRLASVLLRVTGMAEQTDRSQAQAIPLTHDLLGQLANASRHTVARFVRRMSSEGCLSWEYGKVRILDANRLALLTFLGTADLIDNGLKRRNFS